MWPLKRQKKDLKFHISHLNIFSPLIMFHDHHTIVISIFGGWTVRICPFFSTRERTFSDSQNYSSIVSISSCALLILQLRSSQLRLLRVRTEANPRSHQRKDNLHPKIAFCQVRVIFLSCPWMCWLLIPFTEYTLVTLSPLFMLNRIISSLDICRFSEGRAMVSEP